MENNVVNRKAVAALAGVSTTTVTRVTSGRGYVSPEARRKVEEAIRKLNYQPNQVARSLRMRRSNMIAIIAEDIVNPYYSEVIEAMITEARRYGYIAVLYILTEHVESEKLNNVIDEICNNLFAGIVNITLIPFHKRELERLSALHIPMVNLSDGSDSQEELIVLDYETGMREAFGILKEKGRKRLAFVSGTPWGFVKSDGRYLAYQKLVREFGMEEDPRLIIDGDYPITKYFELGYRAGRKLLREHIPFDSVFCMTDMIAPGVVRALAEFGKKVPDDISLFSCDNVQLSGMLSPSVSTMEGHGKELARLYIQYVLGQVKKLPVHFTAEFIRRESL